MSMLREIGKQVVAAHPDRPKGRTPYPLLLTSPRKQVPLRHFDKLKKTMRKSQQQEELKAQIERKKKDTEEMKQGQKGSGRYGD